MSSLSLSLFEIQRARVNGVTLLRVLINEPRAPSSPYPTSFSPLDSTPSIFNHKEVSAPPPRLSRLLLWSVIATYILILVPSFISFFTLVSPVLASGNLLPRVTKIFRNSRQSEISSASEIISRASHVTPESTNEHLMNYKRIMLLDLNFEEGFGRGHFLRRVNPILSRCV